MSSITVTLPDGSPTTGSRGHHAPRHRQVDQPASGRRRRRRPRQRRLVRPDAAARDDATLQILTSKNPEALEVYRHSTAHLLALAVLELFPKPSSASVRPPKPASTTISQRDTPFTPKTSKRSRRRCGKCRSSDLPYERKLTPKAEGIKKYEQMGEFMKCELIDEKADEIFSEYTLGPAVHRFLPRPARAFHQAAQGIQAALDVRRVLEGRREEPPDAAHLRHRVLHRRRSWKST